jgi:hypothetical protein
MDKNAETINKINKDYFNLLQSHIRNFEVCKIDYPANKVWQEVANSTGLVFNSKFGKVNSTQYKALSLLHDILQFWKANKDAYKIAGKDINTNKTYDTQFSSNQYLFFDTIVLYHLGFRNALLVFEENSYDHVNTTAQIIRMARDLNEVLPFLNTNHDKPMVILDIAESINKKRKVNIYGKEIEINEPERSIQNINQIIKEIALEEYKSSTIVDYFLLSQKKGLIDVSRFFNTKLFIEFLDSKLMDEKFSTAKEWNDFMSGRTTLLMSDVFGFLIQGLTSSVMDIDSQEVGCFEFKADPIVNHLELYKNRLTIEATRTSQALGQSLDFGIAQSLKMPNFNWIKDMSEEDLIHFREIGGSDFLRKIFNSQKSKIKNASIEEFESISKEAVNDINKVIIEENKRIIAEKEIIKKKLVKTSISFGATIALGVISVALPPLLVITIPTAVYSTIVGSASAKDINDLLKNKKENERLMVDRPVGIIAKYINNASTQHAV